MIIIWIYFFWIPCIYSGTYTVNDLPSISYENTVQFYYLEASFPSNTPSDIISAAGSAFIDYSTTHAGLGVWDVDSNTKFSIDFIANNFTGALFPDTSHGIDNFAWDNSATIQVTNPLVEDDWINSRLIVATQGVAYQDFVTYLQSNIDSFSVYQPITVSYATDSQLANYTDNSELGTVSLQPFNSYTAVDIWVNQLASFGCSVQAFLQVYSTAFYYLSSVNYASSSSRRLADNFLEKHAKPIFKPSRLGRSETNRLSDSRTSSMEWTLESDDLINILDNTVSTIPIVSWTTETGVNSDVFAWYQQLQSCYEKYYEKTKSEASEFEEGVKNCYGSYAYVYKSSTSVYNVSLAQLKNTSYSTYATPTIGRYIYNLPSVDLDTGIPLREMDYVVSALLLSIVAGGIIYLSRRLFTKKPRRRVSYMGEQIATDAVKTLHEEEQYGRSSIDYYHSTHNDSQVELSSRAHSSASGMDDASQRSLIQRIFGGWWKLDNDSPSRRRPPSDYIIKNNNQDLETPLTLHVDAIKKSFSSPIKAKESAVPDNSSAPVNSIALSLPKRPSNTGVTVDTSNENAEESKVTLNSIEQTKPPAPHSTYEDSEHSDNPLLTNANMISTVVS